MPRSADPRSALLKAHNQQPHNQQPHNQQPHNRENDVAAWLVSNFFWVGLVLVVLAIGLKVAIGAVLKRLMDQSAAEAARRGDMTDPQQPPRE
jgi:hypothetical protein